MKIVEIRDLDGPNLFLLQPAIKIEVDIDGEDREQATDAIVADVEDGHRQLDLAPPVVHTRVMEHTGHVAIAFSWSHRRFAMLLAKLAVRAAADGRKLSPIEKEELRASRSSQAIDDAPAMIVDSGRTIPIIAITGTNGKTTTTRLISSILMQAGKRTGWTSSAGVYIQHDLVLPGDYTGPAGAARVFEEPNVDVAVLETARGGILLRGLGYESNDVSVVTNVSPDHLGLHGVFTVESLAEVKSVVARVTKESGFVILNADDVLSLRMIDAIRAPAFLVARGPDRPRVAEHISAGGHAMLVEEGRLRWHHDDIFEDVAGLDDVPIAFGGRAQHMVENALCAAAACLAYGLDVEDVRAGLKSFRNQADQNRGRLNVFDVEGRIVIVDFAHNELGLQHLLAFGRSYCEDGGRLISVVGTAGDRTDDVFDALGRIAGESSDQIVVKDSTKYLRGRSPGDMPVLIAKGIEAVGGKPSEIAGSEMEGFERALELAKPGDVVAIMCIEDYDTIIPHLERIGTSRS